MKVFADHLAGKGLVFRIHKELLQLSNNKTIKKWATDLNRLFFKEDASG